jgi:hypothetical protein
VQGAGGPFHRPKDIGRKIPQVWAETARMRLQVVRSRVPGGYSLSDFLKLKVCRQVTIFPPLFLGG